MLIFLTVKTGFGQRSPFEKIYETMNGFSWKNKIVLAFTILLKILSVAYRKIQV